MAACLLTGLPAALARLSAWTGTPGSGMVGSGMVGSGMVGSGMVGSGMVGSGMVGSGAVADEPATARALAGHIQRALDAGLLDDADLPVGLTRSTGANPPTGQ